MRWVAGFVIFLLVMIPFGSHLFVTTVLLPRLNANHAKFAQMAPKILQDLKSVAGEPPFPDSKFENDAGRLVEQYVSTESAVKVRDFFTRHPYWKEYPGQFKQMIEDPDFSAIDTEWMQNLSQYDHWNLAGNRAIHDQLMKSAEVAGIERITLWATLPMPTFNDLRQWALLNFLKKQMAGQGLLGLHTFRQAAKLANSSNTLIGSMIAAAMLKDEHFLAEHFSIDAWNTISLEVIEAYRRVSWAWPAMAQEVWFESLPPDFEPFVNPQAGICSAAMEMSAGVGGFQDYIEPRAPFETDFAAGVRRVRAFQVRVLKLCNMETYTGMVLPSPEKTVRDFYSRVPYLRRVMGMMLMTAAVPNFLGIYERITK